MSVEGIAEKLGIRKNINPLSQAAEFYLEMTEKARVILSVHPNGKTRLETRSWGSGHMRQIIESESSQVRIVDDGVQIRFQNPKFDITAHIDSAHKISVSVEPK